MNERKLFFWQLVSIQPPVVWYTDTDEKETVTWGWPQNRLRFCTEHASKIDIYLAVLKSSQSRYFFCLRSMIFKPWQPRHIQVATTFRDGAILTFPTRSKLSHIEPNWAPCLRVTEQKIFLLGQWYLNPGRPRHIKLCRKNCRSPRLSGMMQF